MPNPEKADLVALSVLSAVIAHHIFRRHETYSLRVHAVLIFVPPALVATLVASRPERGWTYSSAFVKSLATYVISLLASIVVYRLSPWHPLARYPGPPLRRATEFVGAYYAATGRKATAIDALHKQYGSVVRIGPNTLSIIDPTAMPKLWNVSRGPWNIGIKMSYKNLTMMGLRDPEEHALRRRPWNRGLNQTAIKEYEHPLTARVQLLVRRLEEQKGEVDLSKWMGMFSMDFMCDMAFGGGIELLRDGEHTNPFRMLQRGMSIASVFTVIPWFAVYLGHMPGTGWALRSLHTTARTFAAKRLQRGSSTRDLFHYLNNEDLSDVPPPPKQHLIGDAILAIVAGSDTTANALVSIFYCILANPATYTALQTEIDKFYSSNDDPCNTRHYQDMHYLHAVINEALRLYNPTNLGGQRQVPPHGPPVIAGSLVLPPGTIFYMPPFSSNRDPHYFSFPSAFWPERWLIASGHIDFDSKEARVPGTLTKDEFVHNEAAFVSFGLGPIGCVGKALATLEMRMVVSALLHKFDFRLRDGWDPNEYNTVMREYINLTTPALPVVLKARW
ncbi:high nitrogen upregulated cytochrome P450 monooxygenase 2 [Lentinus tigrinus ALCF2SS1-7]|uniref:High nitrogen upregulated cytochrome P450 monooxygenase 2 n=1 Tax=Lentinus tigrinus ALCF2SS1-6 TaxID=1328759 RepID=A0A5C2SGZ6_9APHY|nr:high nitrogen upregulated cytochrome P450 monooxygenase 2 [Lentinus tigrinus ALCF2SS1-6]RPD75849.1 high nitrogen upregulated cytochrome P450 monooxygenase 2 [Lentinus tigrinus ALCF2SS1-7]